MKIDMDYIKNHDAAFCATACLSRICKQYNKIKSITQIRQSIETKNNNATLKNFDNGANLLGFDTKNSRMSFELLNSEFTLPAVVYTITKYNCGNFITLSRIKNGKIRYYDPLKGDRTISIREFYNNFPGILLFLTPTEEFNNIEEISTQKVTG